MMENFRRFEAGPDLFGRKWTVEFRWQQNAIVIRHSDTIDVKFELTSGEHVEEKVVALPHPALLELSQSSGRPLTDAWCSRLAALHLLEMIETDRDMDKTLVTATTADLQRHAAKLQQQPQPISR